MNRSDTIIIFSESPLDNLDGDGYLCKACIGRGHGDNLCDRLRYLDKCEDTHFTCIVMGYGKDAEEKGRLFDNTKHKIILSTKECYLCGHNCTFEGSMCDEVYDTICMYNKVKGLNV